MLLVPLPDCRLPIADCRLPLLARARCPLLTAYCLLPTGEPRS